MTLREAEDIAYAIRRGLATDLAQAGEAIDWLLAELQEAENQHWDGDWGDEDWPTEIVVPLVYEPYDDRWSGP